MAINKREEIDELVSNINLNSDMIFFIYSSDRNKIHTLVKEVVKEKEYKHRVISFDVKYRKDVFLKMEIENNKEDSEKDYEKILKIARQIGNIKVFGETIEAPHNYSKTEKDGMVLTSFGWEFEVIKEKKKGTR